MRQLRGQGPWTWILATAAIVATCAASTAVAARSQSGTTGSRLCSRPTTALRGDAPRSSATRAAASPSPSPSSPPPAILCVTIRPLTVSRRGHIVFYAWVKAIGHAARWITVTATVNRGIGAAVRFTHCPAARRAVCKLRRLPSRQAVWLRIRVAIRRSTPGAVLSMTLVATGRDASPATASATVVEPPRPSPTPTPSPVPTVTVTATVTATTTETSPTGASSISLSPLPSPSLATTSLVPTPTPTVTTQVGGMAATASQTPAVADPTRGIVISGPLAESAAGLTVLIILAIIWIRRRIRKTGAASTGRKTSLAVASKAEKDHGPNDHAGN